MARNSMVNPDLTVRELRQAAAALEHEVRNALCRYEKVVGQYPSAVNIKLASHYTQSVAGYDKVLDAVILLEVEVIAPSIT